MNRKRRDILPGRSGGHSGKIIWFRLCGTEWLGTVSRQIESDLSGRKGNIMEKLWKRLETQMVQSYEGMVKEAREQGDLSENAEYDAAKDEQRDIETEIAELEAILANCEVIQDNDKNKDVVKMESVVVLHDVEFDEDIEYTIVGSSEADSLNNKISNESPLGAALIGKKKGDTVKVEAPVGEIEYTVVSVKND